METEKLTAVHPLMRSWRWNWRSVAMDREHLGQRSWQDHGDYREPEDYCYGWQRTIVMERMSWEWCLCERVRDRE